MNYKNKMKQVLKECKELYMKKAEDYNSKYRLTYYFRDVKEVEALLRIKALRLDTIQSKDNVNFESLKDNMLDYINYCVILYYVQYYKEYDYELNIEHCFKYIKKSINRFTPFKILTLERNGIDLALHALFLCVLLQEKEI